MSPWKFFTIMRLFREDVATNFLNIPSTNVVNICMIHHRRDMHKLYRFILGEAID